MPAWERWIFQTSNATRRRAALRLLGVDRPERPAFVELIQPKPAAIVGRGDVAVLTAADGHRHVGDVIDFAAAEKIEQLWIPADVALSLGLPRELPPAIDPRAGVEHSFVSAASATHDVLPRGLAPWLHGWSRDNRDAAVDVVLAGYDQSPFASAASDPDRLVAAVETFTRAVGLPFRRSAGSTGTALLRALHGHRRAVKLDPPAAYPEPARLPVEVDFGFVRPLTDDERGRQRVVAYDVNGMYLAACSSIACGVGEPVEVDVFDKLPGYWHASIEHERDPLLPDPFNVGPAAGYKERRSKRHKILRWFSTPTVELAIERGADVHVRAGIVWPRHHRYLRPWYERLRDARAELIDDDDPAAAIALAAVKSVYRISLGWLGGSFHDDDDELYRPNWRHAVIATARANLFRRLQKIADAGARPFALDVDCAYFVVDGGPVTAAPAGLPLTDQLGHFKVAGSAPASILAGVDLTKPGSLRELREAMTR